MPASVVTNRPPGRNAFSQDTGTDRTDTVATIRSYSPGSGPVMSQTSTLGASSISASRSRSLVTRCSSTPTLVTCSLPSRAQARAVP